jgi:hypothetical protein
VKQLLVPFFAVIIFSCNSKKGREFLEPSLNSLLASNKFIQQNTTDLYTALQTKATDAQTIVRASEWVYRLRGLNDTTNYFIKSIDSFAPDVSSRDIANELDVKLDNYISYLKTLDGEITESRVIENTLIKFKQIGLKEFFTKATQQEVKWGIAALKNSICLTENKIVAFANNSAMPGCNLGGEQFNVLIGQNALHFRQGDELIISAGVGAYTLRTSPTFIVNRNMAITPDENGVATYKKKISESVGKHKIPILLNYTDGEGKKKSLNTVIDYEVH